MHCVGCRERIYERNFDARNRDENTAAICEECLDLGKHLRCMNQCERGHWESCRIWLCDTCIDELSDSDDYDSESGAASAFGSLECVFDAELFEAL